MFLRVFQIHEFKQQVLLIKDECAKANVHALEKACNNLPDSQKLAVQACFNASKVKDIRGIRYTNSWIYECLLLRIKSRKTYAHLRNHKILALPSVETLSRYMKAIKGSYGFNESVFQILELKTKTMDPQDIRGNYVLCYLF